uniref:Class I SAM-dependent methyltransferase n=1 Tax=Thermosphaera aggregans TaxID=54254 RepID=A0A7C2BKE3_9CREN
MSQYENPGLMDLADQCWSICEQALSRTLEYFRRAPKYRDAGWRSIDLARYLEGRVLDIGAGRAGYLRKNTPREGLLILMDPVYDNPPHLEVKAGNIMILNGDGLNMPLRDRSVDVVISLAVLHHFPTKDCRLRFLEEVQRVLVEGGFLLLSVWFPMEKPGGREVCDGVIVSSTIGDRFYHFYTIPELKEEVENAGFLIDNVEIVVENPRKPAETRNILLTGVKQ